MARLLFLGRLEDLAGQAVLSVSLAAPANFPALLGLLPPDLAGAVAAPRVRLALNGMLCAPETLVVTDADELAFLPPVSGG